MNLERTPQDLDDEGKPFDEDAYFAKMGFTKAERKAPDKWAELRRRYREGGIAHNGQSMLDVRAANDWIKQTDDKKAEQRQLFGDFWLEGELCILFADTAKGKSILAVQIAESIARGRAIKPFEIDSKGKVLYLDFELSEAQFKQRYTSSNGKKRRSHAFHRDFGRCQLKNIEVPPAFKTAGEFLAHSIRVEVQCCQPKALIIDNISWLRTSNTNSSAALELMRELKALKESEGLSILVLAHTPKRPFARPLTVNDLAGSKMLANFTDTMFAIGDSIQGSNIRYLKQIKPRSTPLIYDAANVAVARIEKPSNFLKFTFTGHANEGEHLIRSHYVLNSKDGPISVAEHERNILKIEAKKLHAAGLSQRSIADQLGISLGTVNNYLTIRQKSSLPNKPRL